MKVNFILNGEYIYSTQMDYALKLQDFIKLELQNYKGIYQVINVTHVISDNEDHHSINIDICRYRRFER
jgi:hypothetical protein